MLDAGSYREAEAAARVRLAEAEAAYGAEAEETAAALDDLVEALLLLRDRSPEARALAERAAGLRERLGGAESPELAASLTRFGRLLADTEEKERAAALLDRALGIHERASGAGRPEAAATLAARGYLLLASGGPEEARSALDRVLAIREAALGPEHPLTAEALHLLGQAAMAAKDLPRAQDLLERALGVRERSLGPEHPATAETLLILGSVRLLRKQYGGLLPILVRALDVRERTYGAGSRPAFDALNNVAVYLALSGDPLEDLAVARRCVEAAIAVAEAGAAGGAGAARSLHNLVVFIQRTGALDEARRAQERAIALMEGALGPDHPDVASALNALGQILLNQGDAAVAVQAQERALAVFEKGAGPSSGGSARARVNLGEAHWALGDLEGARREILRGLEILERIEPLAAAQVAYVETQAGRLLSEIGDAAGAEARLRRAVSLAGGEEAAGSMTLGALAEVKRRGGDAAEARRLHERALRLIENRFGPDHPDAATERVDLALVAEGSGDLAGARLHLERALESRRGSLGPDHIEVGRTEVLLAGTLRRLGEAGPAFESALAGESRIRGHLRQIVRAVAERSALRYAAALPSGAEIAVAIAERGRDAGRIVRAWDAVARSRSLVLDEIARRRRDAVEARDPALARLGADLARARGRLAHLILRGPEGSGPGRYRRLVEGAQAEKDRAERALAERSLLLRREMVETGAGIQDVFDALPAGGALVAYVRLAGTPAPGRADRTGGPASGAASYHAFVRPARGEVAVVDLGGAGKIDALVAAWRRAAATKPAPAPAAARRAEAAYREAGDALRRAVWDPLRARLQGAARIFVVPDGALHLVNLAALPEGESRYLVEAGAPLHALSTERDLIPAAEPEGPGSGLLAVGAAEFGARPGASGPAEAPAGAGPPRAEGAGGPAGAGGEDPPCASGAPSWFEPLPESLSEVREIGAIWKRRGAGSPDGEVVELTGAGATERRVKELAPGRSVLHVATHGFFAGGPCVPSRKDAGGAAPSLAGGLLSLGGLALAGSNLPRGPAGGDDDGVLTSEEIAGLDLGRVDWAVLSGCETGLGDVLPGEGVAGMRRAFRIAGARTLIMSLWSVQDAAAREWMRGLYAARAGGLSTMEAVRTASVRMIEDRRRAGRSTHPFFWGAFLATGAWR
jgi:CHAT domain-containing protein/Tfp pilus assembly protein PilF